MPITVGDSVPFHNRCQHIDEWDYTNACRKMPIQPMECLWDNVNCLPLQV